MSTVHCIKSRQIKLIIINDAPDETKKAYNTLRLANQIDKDHEDTEVKIFLIADAAAWAVTNQKTANGYYNIEKIIKAAVKKGARVKICGSCADARGLKDAPLIE